MFFKDIMLVEEFLMPLQVSFGSTSSLPPIPVLASTVPYFGFDATIELNIMGSTHQKYLPLTCSPITA